MAVSVRRVRRGEALQLRELRLAALAESPTAFSATLEDMVDQPVAFWVDRVESNADGDHGATFIAEADGRWVGMVAGFREQAGQDFVELVSMWVAPAHRAQGTARLLVDRLLGWAQEISVPHVQLWVMRDSAAAIALYERCGFNRQDDHSATDPAHPCAGEIRMVWRQS